jgi:hypothetical protein
MKRILFVKLALVTFVFTFNPSNSFAYILTEQQVCEDAVSVSNNELVCDGSLTSLLSQENKKAKVKNLPFEAVEFTALGFVDDSSSVAYSHYYRIDTSAGEMIGYVHYFGLSNSESETFFKVSVYYSPEGKVSGAFAEAYIP